MDDMGSVAKEAEDLKKLSGFEIDYSLEGEYYSIVRVFIPEGKEKDVPVKIDRLKPGPIAKHSFLSLKRTFEPFGVIFDKV